MAPFLLTRIFDLVSSSMSASFARSFIAANMHYMSCLKLMNQLYIWRLNL